MFAPFDSMVFAIYRLLISFFVFTFFSVMAFGWSDHSISDPQIASTVASQVMASLSKKSTVGAYEVAGPRDRIPSYFNAQCDCLARAFDAEFNARGILHQDLMIRPKLKGVGVDFKNLPSDGIVTRAPISAHRSSPKSFSQLGFA